MSVGTPTHNYRCRPTIVTGALDRPNNNYIKQTKRNVFYHQLTAMSYHLESRGNYSATLI